MLHTRGRLIVGACALGKISEDDHKRQGDQVQKGSGIATVGSWKLGTTAGVNTLTQHLATQYVEAGGELRLDSSVAEITVADGRVTGVRVDGGEPIEAASVVSAVAPDLTLNTLVSAGAVDAGLSTRLAGIAYREQIEDFCFAADPDLLSQAVINLLHNAADAVRLRPESRSARPCRN